MEQTWKAGTIYQPMQGLHWILWVDQSWRTSILSYTTDEKDMQIEF
jgi:hypothetical protein